jgi:hypothetical protein
MSRTEPDSPYVAVIKSILKEHGFRCRGNICRPNKRSELDVEISFRNRWGRPLHDVGLLIKKSEIGWLVTGDLDHLFEAFLTILHEFREEELRDLKGDAEKRLRSLFTEQIIPQILAWTEYTQFLTAIDVGRFAGNGVFTPAVTKLKAIVS